MAEPLLLAVPNFSEGRDPAVIEALERAATGPGESGGVGDRATEEVRLLDAHSDADHNRSVLTVAGPARRLADAVMRAAEVAVEEIDVDGAGGGGPRPGRPAPPRRGSLLRGPGRVPGATDAGARVRGGAGARRPHRRGAGGAGVPLRRANGLERDPRPLPGGAATGGVAGLADDCSRTKARAGSRPTSALRSCTRRPAPRWWRRGSRSSRSTSSCRRMPASTWPAR